MGGDGVVPADDVLWSLVWNITPWDQVSQEAGQAMAGRIGAAAYLECSALLKEGVRDTLHCTSMDLLHCA